MIINAIPYVSIIYAIFTLYQYRPKSEGFYISTRKVLLKFQVCKVVIMIINAIPYVSIIYTIFTLYQHRPKSEEVIQGVTDRYEPILWLKLTGGYI